jgi:hypothetical protein
LEWRRQKKVTAKFTKQHRISPHMTFLSTIAADTIVNRPQLDLLSLLTTPIFENPICASLPP